MERRRFVPRSEGLEPRALLSVAGVEAPVAPDESAVTVVRDAAPEPAAGDLDRPRRSAVNDRPPESSAAVLPTIARPGATPTTAPEARRPRLPVDPNDPNIAPLRNFKIDRLPVLLQSIRPGRTVPPEIVSALQDDLRLVAGRLVPPPSNALHAFNLQLRSVVGRASLHVEDAVALNRIFGLVLERAGAEPAVIAQFQADMNDLAHFDSSDPSPAPVAASDYALMLQTTLGVGINFQAFQGPRRSQGSAPNATGSSPILNA